MIKKLYLTQWCYNYYLIINEIKKEVLKNGGFIVSDWRTEPEKIKIYNRTLNEDIIKLEKLDEIRQKHTAAEIEELAKNNGYLKGLLNFEEDLKKYDYKKNNGVILTTSSYLHFIINNSLYYIQFNDNPFFDWYYTKEPINGLTATKEYNYYMDILNKEIYDAGSYYELLSKKDIKRIAHNYYNYLLTANYSKPYKKQFNKTVNYNIIEGVK